MAFKSIKDLVDKAYIGGQSHRGTFRKIMQGTATTAGLFYDFTMYPVIRLQTFTRLLL